MYFYPKESPVLILLDSEMERGSFAETFTYFNTYEKIFWRKNLVKIQLLF